MDVHQERIDSNNINELPAKLKKIAAIHPNLLMVFGGLEFFSDRTMGRKLKAQLPNTEIIGCSTAGEISSQGVSDHSLIMTGIRLKESQVALHSTHHSGLGFTLHAGETLAKAIPQTGLKGVFVLAPGVNINGSSLIQGLQMHISKGVPITGGLAGDAANFKGTLVMCNDEIHPDLTVGLGFYGQKIAFEFGSFGGWNATGPQMTVTKAIGNLMMELDGKPALEVYKKLLGPQAADLPGSGLLFPFEVISGNPRLNGTIRTLLGVNETNQSLALAGDILAGVQVQLMKASTSGLVNGAARAATDTMKNVSDSNGLAILVSCVGRKLVMGNEVNKEILAVSSILRCPTITGFYSYGEICPQGFVDNCKLHNQTMTITRIWEN